MEEVSSLRVSLGLDTAEFSQRIQDVNRRLRAIKSEFSAANDGTKAWANSLEGMQAKTENLTRQLEIHRQKVASLRQQYEDVATAQGADSRAAENLLIQYNNSVGVMRRLETSLETVNRRVQEQTSEFGQLQRRVNTSVESMDRELRVLESSFSNVTHGMDGMNHSSHELQQRETELNQSIEIQQRRLAELQNLLEVTTREEGQNSEATQEMQIRYNQANQALNRTQTELSQTERQLRTQSSAWGRLGQALEHSHSQLGMIGMNLQMTGMNIAMSFGIAATAVGGAMGSAIKKSVDFGSQMSKVGAIAGATGKDLDKLKESALDLGAKTSLSASQVAEAQTEMAKKGYKTNQIIAAMPGVISAAEASGEDLAMVADTVSSAINSFGLGAEKATHVADILAKAANDSAAGVEDMQYAFKYAAAPAHALGISMEELAASTEIMADSGIKGETAGTTLRAALLRLVKPPKQAFEAIADLGVKIKDTHGKMLPFSNIIGQLNEKTKGMANAQKTAALAAIFGTEAVSGMLAVVNAGAPKIDKLTQALKNSDGASTKAAKQMKDNLKGDLQELQGSFETAQISIGNALTPAIEKLSTGIKKITDSFNGLSPGMQKFIAIGGAVTAILLAVVTALGFITMAIGGAISAFATISGVLAAAGGASAIFGAAMAAITGPIGIAVLAVVGIGIALVSAYKKIGWFRDMVNGAWSSIKSGWTTAVSAVKNVTQSVISAVSTFIGTQLTKIKAFWNTNGTAITNIVKSSFGAIFAYIQGIMGVIKGVFQAVWPIISGVVKVAWGVIQAVISTTVNLILGIIRTMSKLMQGDWKGAWNAIKQTASNIWNDIVKIFKSIDLVKIGKDIINGLIKGLSSMGSAVVKAAKGVAKSAKDAITSFFDIHSPSRVMQKVGGDVSQGLANGISSKEKSVAAAAKSVAAHAKHHFEDGFRNIQYRVDAKKLNIDEAIIELERLKAKYKEVPNAVERINKEIYKYNQELVKNNAEAYKKMFEDGKAAIDKKKYYNQLSLNEELKLLEDSMKKFKKGTEEREYYEREVYRVKKDIFDKLKALNDDYAQKVQETNKKLNADELKAQQDFTDKKKSIQDKLDQDLISAQNDYASQVKSINDKMALDEQDLTDAYIKSVDDRTKALYNFSGLFDQVNRQDVSGQSLIDNLSGQVGAFEDYQSNMDQLSSKGVSEGLLQELKDAGPKSVDEIKALNSLSAEQLQQYVALWQQKSNLARQQATKEQEGMRLDTQIQIQQLRANTNIQLEQLRVDYVSKVTQLRFESQAQMNQAKTDWVNTVSALRTEANAEMAQYKLDLQTQIADITKGTKEQFDVMNASMKDIGKNTMQGLMDGLSSMTGPLQRQAQAIADSISKTIKKALDIHSPSRVMMEIGQYTGDGLVIGMGNSIKSIIQQANAMAKAAMPNISTPSFGYGELGPVNNNGSSNGGTSISKTFSPSITNVFQTSNASPSEVTRQNQRMLRQLAFQMG